MIAECTADLVARITALPALTNSASIFLGGHGADPGLIKVPLPAVWIIFAKDQPVEYHTASDAPNMPPGIAVMLATFSVVTYLPYASQADLLAVQYPLLESMIKAINGQPSPSGHRWRYTGEQLVMVYPDRIAYDQHYVVELIL